VNIDQRERKIVERVSASAVGRSFDNQLRKAFSKQKRPFFAHSLYLQKHAPGIMRDKFVKKYLLV
jgi:hypothetical protein